MLSRSGFSYVRLGDKDVAFLLYPEGAVAAFADATDQVTGMRPYGTPGLLAHQVGRLRASLEKASYVDYWDRQWRDDTWLMKLNLARPPPPSKSQP